MKNWRFWSDEEIEAFIEDNEDTNSPETIQLIVDMEKELWYREDELPHDEHVGLDMPEGYGA